MESESSCAECLRLLPPEDRELIAPEIFEAGGSGGDDSGTGRCVGAAVGGWRSMVDCDGGTEIGWLATAPKDCCDGRKACLPLTLVGIIGTIRL
jgi:hypothetical protein